MRKLAFLVLGCAVLAVCSSSARAQTGQNCTFATLSLGPGYTVEGCNALSSDFSSSGQTMGFLQTVAVNANDLLFMFADCDMAGGTGNCSWTITDNASTGNTWCESPMTAGTFANGSNTVKHANFFYVSNDGSCNTSHAIGSKFAKASGYQITITATATGGGTINDIDYSVFDIRHSSGNASPGFDIWLSAMSSGNSANTTCNSGPQSNGCAVVSGGQTLAVTSGDLVIGGGNQNNGTAGVAAAFDGVDGDGNVYTPVIPSYYAFGIGAASTGNITLTWYETAANDPATSGLFAVKSPSSGGGCRASPTLPLLGASGKCG